MKHGDFTALADNYAKYRPGYSPFVLDAVISLSGTNPKTADIGAGTGIWSGMLKDAGAIVTAVEPNDAMREQGEKKYPDLTWVNGSAENTTLAALSFDLVSMASSFHWPDFDKAVAEFSRVLKQDGYFLALWNTRHVESNPLLVDIENKLRELVPDLKRVSSGRSEFCDSLTRRLHNCGAFADVLYLEAFHTEYQTPEHYVGLWESVNDVRVQAGPERFALFMDYVKDVTRDISTIEAQYKTRAWLAKKK